MINGVGGRSEPRSVGLLATESLEWKKGWIRELVCLVCHQDRWKLGKAWVNPLKTLAEGVSCWKKGRHFSCSGREFWVRGRSGVGRIVSCGASAGIGSGAGSGMGRGVAKGVGMVIGQCGGSELGLGEGCGFGSGGGGKVGKGFNRLDLRGTFSGAGVS